MDIGKYLQHIGKYPLLSREKERELFVKLREGDSSSREVLINSNLRFVVHIVKRYSLNGNLADLIQSGNEGLVISIDKFNPDYGSKLTTYAKYWIKDSIFSFFDLQDMIHVPSNKRYLRRKAYKIIKDYLQKNSNEPSDEIIAKELSKESKKDYSAKEIRDALNVYENTRVLSLNKPLSHEADSEYIDLVVGSDGREDQLVTSKDLGSLIRSEIEKLKINEPTREILLEKLFLHKTFQELGDSRNISRGRVQQKYQKGLRALRTSLSQRGITKKIFELF